MTESEWFEQLFNRLSHSKFRSTNLEAAFI